MIQCRYNAESGCIEGFQLLAALSPMNLTSWEYDDEVIIHSFAPRCHVHMSEPALRLSLLPPNSPYHPETEMHLHEYTIPPSPTFVYAKPVEPHRSMQFWPPDVIPAKQRVRNLSMDTYRSRGHRPFTRRQTSDTAFRIRQPLTTVSRPEIHTRVDTFATIDPVLYTPTENKPWRGIWVGDYSGHGSEFLLMHQPDDVVPFDENSVLKMESETTEEFEARKKEARTYYGSIEAIKLTGDYNVSDGYCVVGTTDR